MLKKHLNLKDKTGEKEMKKRNILIVVLITGMFLVSQISFAVSVDVSKIKVPAESGRVVEVHTSSIPTAPLIVYVQDIHMNYEAQKAEIAIMETLIRDYGFDLVLLEGKKQDLTTDLKEFRNETKEVKEKAAEELLKKGTILGIEYLDLVSDYNFKIYGVEDMALYRQETIDHIEIFNKTGDTSKLIATLQNIASNLKLHIYTKEQRDLDDKIAAYDKDEIGLVEYVKFLDGVAKANNIDVKGFANVTLFIDSANLEDQIDFAAVETERQAVVDAIEKASPDRVKEEILSKNLAFRTGDISQGAFYAYITDMAKKVSVDISDKKNLAAYASYISTFEKINTDALFKELRALEEKLQAALVKTPEQAKLAEISKGLGILANMANTKLVPDEYNLYLQNKPNWDLNGWLSFLKNNSATFGLTNPVPDSISLLTSSLPLLDRFYATAFDRDKAFVENIKTAMTKNGKDKAIFVAGGFHTPNMKKLFKDNGFSYLIVAPKVEVVKSYEDIYKERTKTDLEYLNQVVQTPAATPANTGGN